MSLQLARRGRLGRRATGVLRDGFVRMANAAQRNQSRGLASQAVCRGFDSHRPLQIRDSNRLLTPIGRRLSSTVRNAPCGIGGPNRRTRSPPCVCRRRYQVCYPTPHRDLHVRFEAGGRLSQRDSKNPGQSPGFICSPPLRFHRVGIASVSRAKIFM